MTYEQFIPHHKLSDFISCYWVVEHTDTAILTQKIIPDGFTEMIFHYASPYEININGTWELQSKNLLAGQITNHFYLRNTSGSGMIGIKFKADSLTQLFKIDMSLLVNKVVNVDTMVGNVLEPLVHYVNKSNHYSDKVKQIDQWLVEFVSRKKLMLHPIQKVVQTIFLENGMIKVNDLSHILNVSERQLERRFKYYIGLSPKMFCRIIRFSYIFRLISGGAHTWTDLAYSAGFFDQSHFIKNFQEFTGEDPSSYGFDEINMANFFLQSNNP